MGKYTKYKKIIELSGFKQVSILLAICYVLSLLASHHWLLDLLSHFKLQYMIGGFVLGCILISARIFSFSLLCFLIAISSFIESRAVLENPYRFFASSAYNQEGFVIAQYNRHIFNTNFKEFRAWLTHENQPDLIILQEATGATIQFVKSIKTLYPYQIQEPRNHAFGMVILSKNPFKSYKRIVIDGPVIQNFLLKMTIEHPDFGGAISVYALHTLPPMGIEGNKQRNQELKFTAAQILKDKTSAKILVGDLNVTPFSPAFWELKRNSGLNYQSFGLFLNPTWPARNSLFTLFQIPIDHLLHSKSLYALNKEVGPSFGSDHNILMSTINLKK